MEYYMQADVIWDAIGSFWANAQNKDVIEELWSGLEASYIIWYAMSESLLNAIAGPDIDCKLDVDTYPYLVQKDLSANAVVDLGGFLDIGGISYFDGTSSHTLVKDKDYTIDDDKHQLTFTLPQGTVVPAGTHIAKSVTLDTSKVIYKVYGNIFDYYPVQYGTPDIAYFPKDYIYALKAMLYTWRIGGYTKNNLEVSIGAIFRAPYTLLGGTVTKIDTDAGLVYVYNDLYKKMETIASNGYTLTVNEGDVLKAMSPLCTLPYAVVASTGGETTGSVKATINQTSTIEIQDAGTPIAYTDNQINFLKCFMDVILPAKYNYIINISGYTMTLPEVNIVVG